MAEEFSFGLMIGILWGPYFSISITDLFMTLDCLYAKLAEVIPGEDWKWPAPRSEDMLAVQIALCGQVQPSMEEDEAWWVPLKIQGLQWDLLGEV